MTMKRLHRRSLLIAACAAAAGSSPAGAQVQDLNDAINKAGRQRMLSQRLAKAYCAIGQGIEADAARRVLDASLATFDRQLVELRAYAPNAAIRETYQALDASWSEYKSLLVGAAPVRDKTARLVALDTSVLALAHQGTQQYEAASGRAVGKLVNVAGRQRMLSQRTAKFYLALAWQPELPGAAAELDKARREFVAAHTLLDEAPQATPDIRERLALAQNQWVFFDNALQRAGEPNAAARRAADVFRTSENILQVMDQVTGLFARLA